jgi:hypothetical protein
MLNVASIFAIAASAPPPELAGGTSLIVYLLTGMGECLQPHCGACLVRASP